MDEAGATTAVLVNKEASLAALSLTDGDMKSKVEELGDIGFVQLVREHLLGRSVEVRGRSIVDEQGAMILAEAMEVTQRDAQMRASELRTLWGWS